MTQWTADQDAQLSAGVEAGQTYQQIATAMGGTFTRNAVIGRALRLGLKSKSGQAFAGGRRILTAEQLARKADKERERYATKVKPVRRAAPKAPSTIKPPKPIAAVPATEQLPRMVSLLDLKKGDCRFPIGDPKQPSFGFCGHRREACEPYCSFHVRLAYAPRVVRREAVAA